MFGVPPINSNVPLKGTRDHIIPRSKGGIDNPVNIVQACHKCNSIKGSRTLSEFALYVSAVLNMGRATFNGYTLETLETILKNIEILKLREREIIKTIYENRL